MQNVSLAVQHRTVSLFGHTDDDFTDHFHDKDVTRYRLPYDLKLYWLIDEQIHSGARTFITGLRDGVDRQTGYLNRSKNPGISMGYRGSPLKEKVVDKNLEKAICWAGAASKAAPCPMMNEMNECRTENVCAWHVYAAIKYLKRKIKSTFFILFSFFEQT